MGGGGRFVPLIGDTQQFSSISCCSTDRYEQTVQNSSNEISQLFSSADELSLDEADDKIDDVDDDDSDELIVCDDDVDSWCN